MAVVGFPLVAYFGKKLNYDRTEYKILEGRLEFEEGFFNINEKVIKFKDVKEVTPRKSFLQRIYDLGTISGDRRDRLLSADQCIFCSRIGNVCASGGGVCDIRNETFEKIRNIVDTQKD